MKKLILPAVMLILLSSCTQRGCQRLEKKVQFSERKYTIEVYSGGEIVFKDEFTGIINQEESSDGVYYIKNGVLVEISGDYIIRSTDN